MLADLARAGRVLPNARRFHYSNLGLAVLGQLVAKLRGGTWAEILTERILDPLGLGATTVEMRWPLTTTDEALWGAGFGLGLILVPEPKRVVHVGHDGTMPGFLAA